MWQVGSTPLDESTTLCSFPLIFITDREYLHTFSRMHAYSKQNHRAHSLRHTHHSSLLISSTLTLPTPFLFWLYYLSYPHTSNLDSASDKTHGGEIFLRLLNVNLLSYLLIIIIFCLLLFVYSVHQIPM